MGGCPGGKPTESGSALMSGRRSEHPLGQAILRRAGAEGIEVVPVEHFRAVKGKGAEGEIEGRPFWVGSHRLMDEKGQETPEAHDKAEELEDAGHSVVAIGND